MLFGVCTTAGLLKSASFSKRVRQLEGFTGALDSIATEIRYFAAPLEDIMAKCDALPEYGELRVFGLCRKIFMEERDFPAAWEKALGQAKPSLALDAGDHEALSWFGRVLGTTDVDGQTANCARYGELLRQRLERAREDRARRGKMYTSLGVLAGIFLVVILF
ncbi:Sporulation stage III protein AB [Ethanoligenens harbinense YUAN-3]|uniref:Sporulation stage III protein AB n=1 Tax=Ethanoligenens harbinense (strain DSM 18485 / JCM 12961 / CGMCC 1.5033 / YUAN-3) TaxID=663278 RepID=E6U545_ETHHY|nr:Sporulation stage III protein AB [Ethanoligenens harbinense YUAN-3]